MYTIQSTWFFDKQCFYKQRQAEIGKKIKQKISKHLEAKLLL